MGLVILTGASGSGKTVIAEAITSRYAESVDVYHFDQVGVPCPEEMIANYGSTEAWQLAKTHEWMMKIAANRPTKRHILFEGQMRCSFALEAAAAAAGPLRRLIVQFAAGGVNFDQLIGNRPKNAPMF